MTEPTSTYAMPTKALAPWFGNKRTMAPKICEMVKGHSAFWDLCTGGCAIIPVKPRSPMETVVDLHGGVINLIRVVQDDNLAPELYYRAKRTAACNVLYEEAAERCLSPWRRKRVIGDDPPDLDWASDYLVMVWLGRNGLAGTVDEGEAGFCMRYSDSGGATATRFRSVVESIPAWWQRLRGVTALQADVRDVLPRIPDEPGHAIYIDPPYITKGNRYVYDFDGQTEPTKPLFGEDDSAGMTHGELAALLSRFDRARVVVSYYDHPTVRALYPSDNWTITPVPATKHLANSFGNAGGPVT